MTITTSTYARARSGALLLDRHLPGWHEHVVASRIFMASDRDNVLALVTRNDPRVHEYMLTIMHPRLAAASLESCHGTAMLLFGQWPTRELMYRHGFDGDVWARTHPAPVNLLDGAWFHEVSQRGGKHGGRQRRLPVLPPDDLDAAIVA